MANNMRSLSDVEVDAVAGGIWDLLISSVVGPTIATRDGAQSTSSEKD